MEIWQIPEPLDKHKSIRNVGRVNLKWDFAARSKTETETQLKTIRRNPWPPESSALLPHHPLPKTWVLFNPVSLIVLQCTPRAAHTQIVSHRVASGMRGSGCEFVLKRGLGWLTPTQTRRPREWAALLQTVLKLNQAPPPCGLGGGYFHHAQGRGLPRPSGCVGEGVRTHSSELQKASVSCDSEPVLSTGEEFSTAGGFLQLTQRERAPPERQLLDKLYSV